MAKSLRSKWVRKCKREKRVRYGKKELTSLLTLVEKANKNDVVVRDAVEVVREKAQKLQPAEPEGENTMEATTSGTSEEPVPTLRTLIKKTGAAPKWLHPRRLKKSKNLKKKKSKASSRKDKFLG
ncbi:protein LLP homolog [Portunus trituberculatus]|uniref:protein LLP homolog n=1 Tax=Portunus trituberculatus TaxID=210409 RepID=UPI001E1CB005|nr:protein LLP homolog [Portunus trituberculatus]